jgi:hypothetical protein
MNKRIDQVGILLQVVLIICVLYLLIMSIFINEFMVVLQAVCGLTLLCMAYNNQITYKRKLMTFIYGIVGIFCLVTSLFF